MNFWLFSEIHGLAGHRSVDVVMELAAQYLLFGVLGALPVLLLVRLRTHGVGRAVQDGLWTVAALVVSYAFGLVAAAVHPEARPFTAHPQVRPLIPAHPDQSFPSDHATAAFAVALVVLAFLSRRVGVLLLICAALIAFSRVYVGVHYPGDVLGSMLVAMLGVGAVVVLREFLGHGQSAARASADQSGLISARP